MLGNLLKIMKKWPISGVLCLSVFQKNPSNSTHLKQVEAECRGQAPGMPINKGGLSVALGINETLTQESQDMDLED